jgi:hypothetical protein
MKGTGAVQIHPDKILNDLICGERSLIINRPGVSLFTACGPPRRYYDQD